MARRGGWAVVAVALLLPGCRPGRSSAPRSAAPRLRVVAGLFPLAEVARRVGLDRVTVTDLMSPGSNPRNVDVPAGGLDGAVVVMVGRGYQPGLEAAVATGSTRPKVVVALWDEVGGNQPELWLDPKVMPRVTTLVADALSRADPGGRTSYRDGARAYAAQLGALDIDYRSSLSDCARRDVVTADAVFGSMATRYGFTDHTVAEPDILRLMQARRVPTIFTEPLIPAGAALALAQAARARVDSLTTLETRTPEEAGRGASYLSLMTDNLAKLRTALACTVGAGG